MLAAAALLTAAALLAAATLLTATLSAAAALLTAALFFAFVWILLCVHDTFLVIACFGRSHLATGPFLIKSTWKAIWTETQTQGAEWSFYPAKPYPKCYVLSS